MKILLTGGTGFIGARICRIAVEKGHLVGALARPQSRTRLPSASGITAIDGDLEEPDWEAIRAFGPDVCVHAAWIATPGIYLTTPKNREYRAWSEAFIGQLLVDGLPHVVGLGSCAEQAAPESEYGAAKRGLHASLVRMALERGASLAWGRIFFPYGPGEPAEKLCSSLIESFRAKRPPRLNNPESVRDFVQVDDLARAILLLAEQNATGEFDLGTGDGARVARVAEILAGLFASSWLPPSPSLSSPSDDAIVADSGRIRDLGWIPEVSLERGLEEMIAATAR